MVSFTRSRGRGRGRQARKRNGTRRMRGKKAVAHLSKPVTRAIRNIAYKTQETKYVSYEINDGYIYGALNKTNGSSASGQFSDRFQDIIPPVSQGSGSSFTRMGNKITVVKAVATVQYYFNGIGVKSPVQDASAVVQSGLYEVRQFVVTAKAIRGAAQWEALDGAKYQSYMGNALETGLGYSVAPNSAYPQNFNYPLANENFTPHAGNKKFIMGKNAGLITQGAFDPLTNTRAVNTI